jgi:cell division protein FtsB
MFANLKPYLPTAVFALGIFYFGYQAFTGDRGMLTAPRREVALAARQQDLKRLEAERADLETQVRLLSDEGLSRDLLDERAREVLGFTDPNDFIIRRPHAAD